MTCDPHPPKADDGECSPPNHCHCGYVRPDRLYRRVMADPEGKYLIAGAAVCLLLGHFSIQRIVNIKA